MTRLTSLTSPFLLGFDEFERALERVAKTASDGYPPYNIERLAPTGEVFDDGHVSAAARTRRTMIGRFVGFGLFDRRGDAEQSVGKRHGLLVR